MRTNPSQDGTRSFKIAIKMATPTTRTMKRMSTADIEASYLRSAERKLALDHEVRTFIQIVTCSRISFHPDKMAVRCEFEFGSTRLSRRRAVSGGNPNREIGNICYRALCGGLHLERRSILGHDEAILDRQGVLDLSKGSQLVAWHDHIHAFPEAKFGTFDRITRTFRRIEVDVSTLEQPLGSCVFCDLRNH